MADWCVINTFSGPKKSALPGACWMLLLSKTASVKIPRLKRIHLSLIYLTVLFTDGRNRADDLPALLNQEYWHD